MAINITKKFSTQNTTSLSGRKILYIVEHYTAGVSSKAGSAESAASWFANPVAKSSADFIVDDASIVQLNPDPANRYCWAVGGGNYGTEGGRLYGVATNANCISIEICSTNSTGSMTYANDPRYSFTDAAVKNAAELTKYLMQKYGIDADHVIRHYDVNGKLCPGVIGWNADSGNESKWKAFKKMLEDEPKIEKGSKVKLITSIAIRDGVSTSTKAAGYVKYKELSDSAKKKCTRKAGGQAVLKKGNVVQILETKNDYRKNMWIRIKSGWLPIKVSGSYRVTSA
jgi:N-acetylmuramoyl-L-alanine amidase CwlA